MFLAVFVTYTLLSCVSLTPLHTSTALPSILDDWFKLNNSDPAMQIYNSVVVGDYGTAVKTTQTLKKQYKGDPIISAVNKLLLEGNAKIVEYAYSLWHRFGEDVVKIYFPIEFRLLFNEGPVMIYNQRDGLPLKLELAQDYAGDRSAYGSGTVELKHLVPRVSWKLFPIWERNTITFKLLNVYQNQYLKLEVKADDAGDHKAYGAKEEDTWRHEWYLRPVVHGNHVIFYIYNREYGQPLKLARAVETYGDRQLWGHNGTGDSNPEHYGWHIAPY